MKWSYRDLSFTMQHYNYSCSIYVVDDTLYHWHTMSCRHVISIPCHVDMSYLVISCHTCHVPCHVTPYPWIYPHLPIYPHLTHISTPYPYIHTLPIYPHLTHISTPYLYIHTLPIYSHLTIYPHLMYAPYHIPYLTKLLTKHTLHYTISPISPYTYHLYHNHTLPEINFKTGEGHGSVIAQRHLGPGRIHHCMRMVGMAERALQMMCWRSTQRETFGKPLYRHVRHLVHPVLQYRMSCPAYPIVVSKK